MCSALCVPILAYICVARAGGPLSLLGERSRLVWTAINLEEIETGRFPGGTW